MLKKNLVLAGGGHAHVFVLEAMAHKPMPDVAVTLVTKEPMGPIQACCRVSSPDITALRTVSST